MQVENDILFIDDGSVPSFGRSVLARPGVFSLSASAPPPQLAAMPVRPRCVLLHVAGEARAQWLRELLRLKWPIACAWPDTTAADGAPDDDPRWLDQLAAATSKRRLPSCVLGAWRVLPALASLKELISGGCLGEILEVDWTWGDEAGPSRRYQWFADDVLRWLAGGTATNGGQGGQGGQGVLSGTGGVCGQGLSATVLASPLVAGEALCSVVGSAGQAVARLRLPAGAGCVESVLGARRRRQEYSAVNGLELELTLLWRFACRELKNWPALAMLNDDGR